MSIHHLTLNPALRYGGSAIDWPTCSVAVARPFVRVITPKVGRDIWIHLEMADIVEVRGEHALLLTTGQSSNSKSETSAVGS
jgi:hypothetical protein